MSNKTYSSGVQLGSGNESVQMRTLGAREKKAGNIAVELVMFTKCYARRIGANVQHMRITFNLFYASIPFSGMGDMLGAKRGRIYHDKILLMKYSCIPLRQSWRSRMCRPANTEKSNDFHSQTSSSWCQSCASPHIGDCALISIIRVAKISLKRGFLQVELRRKCFENSIAICIPNTSASY